jgi:hypothetical protein
VVVKQFRTSGEVEDNCSRHRDGSGATGRMTITLFEAAVERCRAGPPATRLTSAVKGTALVVDATQLLGGAELIDYASLNATFVAASVHKWLLGHRLPDHGHAVHVRRRLLDSAVRAAASVVLDSMIRKLKW